MFMWFQIFLPWPLVAMNATVIVSIIQSCQEKNCVSMFVLRLTSRLNGNETTTISGTTSFHQNTKKNSSVQSWFQMALVWKIAIASITGLPCLINPLLLSTTSLDQLVSGMGKAKELEPMPTVLRSTMSATACWINTEHLSILMKWFTILTDIFTLKEKVVVKDWEQSCMP